MDQYFALLGALLAEANAGGEGGAGGGAGGEGGASPFSLLSNMFPILAIFVLFWLIVIRPSKRKTDQSKALEDLKKNDRVVTIGGIFGTVVSAQKGVDEVVLRIDENTNTRVHVLRSAIARIVNATDGEDKKESE